MRLDQRLMTLPRGRLTSDIVPQFDRHRPIDKGQHRISIDQIWRIAGLAECSGHPFRLASSTSTFSLIISRYSRANKSAFSEAPD